MRQFLTSENLFFKKYVRLEFDEQEKPSMLIGKAVHKGLERLFQDEIDQIETEKRPDYNAFVQDQITEMLTKAREKTSEKLGFKLKIAEKDQARTRTKDGEIVDQDETEAKIETVAIAWSKTINEEEARKQADIAMKNYTAQIDHKTFTTISTEISETVLFSDLDGNIMPVPLKGIMDKIVRHIEQGEGLTDYKVVAKLSDPDKRNPGYELQASAFYFIYYGLKGKAPEFAMFEEILKKEAGLECVQDPKRKLLQADLKQLCDANGVTYEKFSKNVELQEKLLEIGVLRKAPTIQTIVYRFEDRKDILEAFIEVYRRIVNRLGLISFFNVPYDELLDPFDQMNGAEAREDFTETLENQIDTKKKTEKVEEIGADLDDYDF